MWLENKDYWPEIQEKSQTKNTLDQMKQEIHADQRTIQAISYLTTLARLPENRDLDELFDGEVQLWEEELLSVYALLEMMNGANTISTLKSPKTLLLDINWDQDYKYKVWYNILLKDGRKIHQIAELFWSGTLPLNDTKLKINYDNQQQVESVDFERPFNFNETSSWWVDQKIVLKREKGLVKEMSILRDFELDNKLIISYNSLWKPELLEQTKVWVFSDKMAFEYDEWGSIKSIIYIPALSLKHLKWLSNSIKQWQKIWWPLRAVKIGWEYIAFQVLKKMKWVDGIDIVSKNGVIQSTTSNLDASYWVYKKWFTKSDFSSTGELEKLYLERELLWPDDKKTLQIKY